MSKPICALARMPCPRTGDPIAKVFCPHWKENIPEHEKDGSGRIIALHFYTGCQVPKLIPYMQSMTVEVDHAHVAANQARDASLASIEEFRSIEGALRGSLLTPLLAVMGLGGQVIDQTPVPHLLSEAKERS